MPSGSHGGGFSGGGGGGSHFGGGSFGGSHGSGSHFGGSYYHGPRQPGRAPIHFTFFYFGGRRYSVAADDHSKIKGMFFFAVMCLIMAVVWAFCISWTIKGVQKIEKDYIYYQDMITYAEAHPDHIIDATVQTFHENENCGKYYVTYYFYTTADHEEVYGYTFSIYTYEQARDIKYNGTIQLAVDEYPLTDQTDSINMDYKNLPLEADGEYQVAKKDVMFNVIAEIVLDCVTVFLILSAIKELKKDVEQVPEGQQPKMLKKYICTYCGSKLREEDTTCPKCGSSTIDTVTEKEKQS